MKLSKSLLLLGLVPFCANAFGYTVPTSGYGNPYRGNYSTNYQAPKTTPVNVNLNRYTVVQNQQPAAKATKAYPKWYAGANIFYNLAKFESKHLTNGVYDSSDPYSKDDFSVGQLGGAISFGQKFNKNWRLEAEAGYFSKYDEQEEGADFGISAPYLIANVMYDMDLKDWGGFYFGAGIGAAFVTTSLESWRLFSGDKKKTSVSPMGALMIGYQYPINEKFFLDVRYRLSGFNGTEHTQQWMANDGNDTIYDFTNDTGFILNNALSVGVRYEF